MTKTREKKRLGPRSPLGETDPQVARVKQRLLENGHKSLSKAAMSVGFQPNVLVRILRDGLSADPHQSTVERLKRLGIFDLVPRRESA